MKAILAVLLGIICLANSASAQTSNENVDRLLRKVLEPTPISTATEPTSIKTQYERFEDKTIISVNLENVAVNQQEEADLYLLLFYQHKGTKNTAKMPVALSFTRSAPSRHSPRFSPLPKLFAIADGERLDLGESLRGENDIQSIGSAISVSEEVFVEIPYDQFQKLFRCKSVELKLGSFSFALKPNHLEKLREFADRTKVE